VALADKLTVADRLIVLTSVDAFQVAHAKQLKQFMFHRVEFPQADHMLHLTALPVMDSLTGLVKDCRLY
jgi:hypothetical protein